MKSGLEFFTSVPGMLISGGVLLLVIALIILLVQHKKAKKASGQVVDQGNAQPQAEVGVAQPMVGDPNAPVAAPEAAAPGPMPVDSMNAMPEPVPVAPMPAPEPVPVEAQPGVMDQVTPVANTDNVVMPAEVPMAQGEVMPEPIPQTEAEQVQAMPQPTVIPDDQVANVAPVAAPEPAPVEPITPEVAPEPQVAVVPEAPVAQPEPQPQPQPQPTIYGGADPSVVPQVTQDNNTPHQIYGGADPMENTQTIPSVAPAQPAPVTPEVAPAPAPQPNENAYSAVPAENVEQSPIPSIQSIN